MGKKSTKELIILVFCWSITIISFAFGVIMLIRSTGSYIEYGEYNYEFYTEIARDLFLLNKTITVTNELISLGFGFFFIIVGLIFSIITFVFAYKTRNNIEAEKKMNKVNLFAFLHDDDDFNV